MLANFRFYREFYRFGHAKLGSYGLILGSSQFSTLNFKVLKIDFKIIISLCLFKFVTNSAGSVPCILLFFKSVFILEAFSFNGCKSLTCSKTFWLSQSFWNKQLLQLNSYGGWQLWVRKRERLRVNEWERKKKGESERQKQTKYKAKVKLWMGKCVRVCVRERVCVYLWVWKRERGRKWERESEMLKDRREKTNIKWKDG